MLPVQEYLHSGKTFADLTEEFGIKTNFHPELPLVILSYDQIESPKIHPIVMCCRGIVLETTTYNLVCGAMTRFFNMGEALEITDKFDWNSPINCRDKEDGSLMTAFWYKGQWMVKTRQSWADSLICENGPKWSELFWELVGKSDTYFFPNYAYVFEMCSMWNQVVRLYPEPKLFLLTIIEFGTNREVYHTDVDFCAEKSLLERPAKIDLTNVDAVKSYIKQLEETDGTAEGLVLQDVNGLRIKVKSSTYLAYSRLGGNGNIALTRNIVPLILANEQDEVISIFPQIEPKIREVQEQLAYLERHLDCSWAKCHGIEDQKEFALAIKDEPMNSILFRMKKDGTIHKAGMLNKYFRNAEQLILKIIDK